jgi:hypothetical protein
MLDRRTMKGPKGKKRSYTGTQGLNKEDLRPLASRQLTLREMRDAGIWKPLREEKEKSRG